MLIMVTVASAGDLITSQKDRLFCATPQANLMWLMSRTHLSSTAGKWQRFPIRYCSSCMLCMLTDLLCQEERASSKWQQQAAVQYQHSHGDGSVLLDALCRRSLRMRTQCTSSWKTARAASWRMRLANATTLSAR